MAREPKYPQDAAIGADATPGEWGVEESAPASEPLSSGREEGGRRKKHLVTGAAIGIGSAAIVAALLYANRGRKNDR